MYQKPVSKISLFEHIYGNEDLNDHIRMRLILTCFDAHIEKLINDKIID